MSRNKNTTFGGIPIYAVNRDRQVHIGTVKGAVYEKGLTQAGMLRLPKLSVTLGIEELAQVEKAGAEFLRVQRRDAGLTHAISIADFKAHGKHIDRGFGPQIAVELHHFVTTHAVVPRNPILDAPIMPSQPSLFDWGRP